MLAVQLKQTTAVDIVKPLRTYIAKEYSEAEADKFQASLEALAQMRKDVEAVRTPSPMSRQVLLRYHAQLELLATRFPIGDTQVKVPFTWYDSFCPRQKLTQNSIKFEQDSVMFLVGALESQSAVNCDRNTAEGLKAACHHFMQAAGAFSLIHSSQASGARTVDMSNEGLFMLINLMLAQAQACFYEKAIKDKMKDGIKSKLATQAIAFYTSALDFANSSTMKSNIDRLWGVHIEFQVMCMKAAAQYWQAKASKDVALVRGSGYGEEIARLATADSVCAQAINHANEKRLPPSLAASVRQLKSVILDSLNAARKDNDTIYMETIPKMADLPVLSAAAMVKSLMPEKEKVPDLFEGLVPTWLRQKIADFEATVQSIVAASATAVAAHNEAARSHLAVLGLPAAVEAFEKGSGLPQSLWKRIESCQAQGLTAPISRILEENKRAKVQLEEQLRHIENLLRDEAQDDMQAKSTYGDRWTRAPSANLNATFYAEVDRYHKLLREATQTDLAITASLTKPELVMLGQTQTELEAKIPHRDPSAATVDTSLLSNLMVALGVLIQKRDEMQAELAAEAATNSSLAVLAASSEDILATKLATIEQKRSIIEGTFSEQADMLTDITERNDLFKQARQADPVTRQREQALLDIQRAIELYEQLHSNATEGGAFYAELAKKLVHLEQTVTDHCAARALEKREMELNFSHQPNPSQVADDSRLAQELQQSLHLHDDQVAADAAYAASLAAGSSQHYSAPPATQPRQQPPGYSSAPPSYQPPNSSAPPPPYQPSYGTYPAAYGNHHPANPYPPSNTSYNSYNQNQPPMYPSGNPYNPPPQPQYGNYFQQPYNQQQYQQPYQQPPPQYAQPYGQQQYQQYPPQYGQYPGQQPPRGGKNDYV
ncbi:programmed cell death 6-interacting protein [Thraustotheca clavata]|uniref:Programmed cell death 6-interacting protein n=1 Tax=Thraustotheca clavata TaxID=74557 RepID=A0A1W0AA46_9STRA|nr:programmed cell death 6-interacting protein [Thraustotheca clavata]